MLAPPSEAYPRRRGVLVDWYSFRTQRTPEDVRYAVAEAFIADGLTCAVEWGEQSPRNGFTRAWAFSMCDKRLGDLCTGGSHMRGWSLLSMAGAGCGMVADWDSFHDTLRGNLPDLQLKRVDLAVDVFDGSLPYEQAEAAWEAGLFDPPRGPRPARDRKGFPENGRTFYVGNRSSADRFTRVYEKGLESGFHPWGDGVPLSAHVRCEVEFKPVNGPLPLDLIRNRGAYFAGASEFCRSLLAASPGMRALRDPLVETSREVAAVVRQLRRSTGAQLVALLELYRDPRDLIDVLTAGQLPSTKLIDAGIRMLEREDLARLGL